jgi:rhodanese-related sulfurtransferase
MSQEISAQELSSEIQKGSVTVIEVLPESSFISGHLPGAMNLPLEGFEAAAVARLPQRNAEIVVYCSGPTCPNSHLAGKKLSGMGYTQVRVFAGGKAAWKDAGLPLEVSR